MASEDAEEVCGEAFDHKCQVVYEDEILIQWRCLVCGAEGEEAKEATDGQDV